jgi:heme exporter protein CcmD
MSNNWNFVIAGYLITAAVLIGYLVWVKQRSRQLRRSVRDENND